MQRRMAKANLRRPNNPILKSALIAVAVALSDIEELFARVKVGDRVSLIAEQTDEVAQIFGPAPASSSTRTLMAGDEPRSSSADEQIGDR